jgi:Domain of unknown function (DUF4175)
LERHVSERQECGLSQHPIEEGGSSRPADGAITQKSLQRALLRAGWAIAWERLWPPLATLAMVAGLFMALSWAGVWLRVPPLGRSIGLSVLLLLAVIAALPLARFRWPSLKDRLSRLDSGSGLTHRPATAVADAISRRGCPGRRSPPAIRSRCAP